MATWNPRANDIFLDAREVRDPAARSAMVDEACRGEPELRDQVRALLAAGEQAGSFLDRPAVAPGATGTFEPAPDAETDPVSSSVSVGAQVGPYKLLQQIGEGGMGTVFMAEQTEPIKRKVALKVIKPGMGSRQVIARFEAERQALAMMDHVNIARVFDGGATESGRPYFVMELVHGVPITKYCDDNHLTPRERLELFVPVCQAIQHAHQKGIIHRDIKPSNVMVTLYDGKPVPKVIDFGVAKATEQKLTERTLFTQYGSMVGTLEYMSPEQAEMSALGVDTRSDIYSLGVLLYELLTGSTPLTHKRMKEAAYAEILRMIKEEEPPKPSTRLSDSGEALASISAQRHMEPTKLSKMMRGELDWIVMKTLEKDRNRRYETANGFAADVQRYLNDEPVQACPPSAWYRFRKFARRNKRALATVAVLSVMLLVAVGVVAGSLGWVARDKAARQTAIEVEVDLALTEAERLQGQQKYPEALSSAKRAEGLLAGGGRAEFHDRVREVRKDLDMVLRLEEIRLQGAIASLAGDAFDDTPTDSKYAQAFRDYGIDVVTLEPGEAAEQIRRRPIRLELAGALDGWADARKRHSKSEDWKRLLALARAADPDDWRNRVRGALERQDREALLQLAASERGATLPPITLVTLARAMRSVGDSKKEVRPLVGNHSFFLNDNAPAAAALLRQAQRQHPGDFWINYELAHSLQIGQPPPVHDAIAFYRVAVALRPDSSAAHFHLANVLGDAGMLEETISSFQDAVRLRPDWALAHNNLGLALKYNGQLDKAMAGFREAIRVKPDASVAHNNLGIALTDQGRLDDAIAAFQEAIRFQPDYELAHNNVGVALIKKGRLDEAIAAYREAIRLKPGYAGAWNNLGAALRQKKAFDEAVAAYREAIRLNQDYGPAYRNLAWVLATCPEPKVRDPAEAVRLAKKAVELRAKNGDWWNTLGVAHYRAGNWNDAIAALEKSMELNQGGSGVGWIFLAMAHWRLGKQDQARKHYDQAVRWMEENKEALTKAPMFAEELGRFRVEATDLLGIKKK